MPKLVNHKERVQKVEEYARKNKVGLGVAAKACGIAAANYSWSKYQLKLQGKKKGRATKEKQLPTMQTLVVPTKTNRQACLIVADADTIRDMIAAVFS